MFSPHYYRSTYLLSYIECMCYPFVLALVEERWLGLIYGPHDEGGRAVIPLLLLFSSPRPTPGILNLIITQSQMINLLYWLYMQRVLLLQNTMAGEGGEENSAGKKWKLWQRGTKWERREKGKGKRRKGKGGLCFFLLIISVLIFLL